MTIELPDEMTPAMTDALGQPNFACGPVAELFRVAGHPIPRKSEAEQAFVIYWSLKLAIQHGDDWRNKGGEELQAIARKIAGGEA